MATMIDPKPALQGEGKVWESIKSNLPDSVIAYNNRELFGREFDMCLLIENYGILIIEIKGWISSKLRVINADTIEIEGYTEHQQSPKKQARSYRFHLLDKLRQNCGISPLIFDMVCYPFISEEEYTVKHLDIVSDKMLTLFREDLNDPDRLWSKIKAYYSSFNGLPRTSFTGETLDTVRSIFEPPVLAEASAHSEMRCIYLLTGCVYALFAALALICILPVFAPVPFIGLIAPTETIPALMFVLLSILFMLSLYHDKRVKDPVLLSVSAGSYRNYEGKPYKTVIGRLESLGFTNIVTENLNDSGLLFWRKDRVCEVKIGDEAHFKSGDSFDINTIVTVKHH